MLGSVHILDPPRTVGGYLRTEQKRCLRKYVDDHVVRKLGVRRNYPNSCFITTPIILPITTIIVYFIFHYGTTVNMSSKNRLDLESRLVAWSEIPSAKDLSVRQLITRHIETSDDDRLID